MEGTRPGVLQSSYNAANLRVNHVAFCYFEDIFYLLIGLWFSPGQGHLSTQRRLTVEKRSDWPPFPPAHPSMVPVLWTGAENYWNLCMIFRCLFHFAVSQKAQESILPAGFRVPTWVKENPLLLFLEGMTTGVSTIDSNECNDATEKPHGQLYCLSNNVSGAVAGPNEPLTVSSQMTLLPPWVLRNWKQERVAIHTGNLKKYSFIYIVLIMKRECFAFPQDHCTHSLNTQWGKWDENWHIMLQGNQMKSQSLRGMPSLSALIHGSLAPE